MSASFSKRLGPERNAVAQGKSERGGLPRDAKESSVSSKIGFIGLGIMGKPMVKNLLKAGHEVTVYDIMPAGMDEMAAAGAQKGSSPKDVAGNNDIIITMVPDGPEVEQAVLGPNGVLEGARKGSTVIDMSSISPMVSQKVGSALERRASTFSMRP
jgi:2-hydroxy-3-oxopropionate reductase